MSYFLCVLCLTPISILNVIFQVHSQNFNVGIQALMLLDKISSKNQIASDRFYRALYSKLLLPAAMHTSKACEIHFFIFTFFQKKNCCVSFALEGLSSHLFSGGNVYWTYSESNEEGCQFKACGCIF